MPKVGLSYYLHESFLFTEDIELDLILLSRKYLSEDAKGEEERHPLRGVGHYEEVGHDAK